MGPQPMQTTLLIIALGIIAVFFVVAVLGMEQSDDSGRLNRFVKTVSERLKRLVKTVSDNAPPLSTSLGIFFTFVGIYIAFKEIDFDGGQGDIIFDIACVSIGVFFIIAVFGINQSDDNGRLKRFVRTVSDNAPSLLTTLGILFTFVGIFIALQDVDFVDTGNIRKQIEPLLGGMKIAFGSSVLGLGLAFAFRFILKPLIKVGDDQEATSAILSEMKAQTEGIEGLRQDFRDFAKNIEKANSEALVKAIEKVMNDFNAKINEQLGENFKHFNEAVGKLHEWQEEYKGQVEALTNAFNESQKGIEAIKDNMAAIEKSCQNIPEHLSRLEEVINLANQRMEELHAGLASLAEMREKAADAIPEIQTRLESIISDMQKGAKNFQKCQQEAMDNLAATVEKITERAAGIVTDFREAVSDMISELVAAMTVVRQKISAMTSELAAEMQRSVKHFQADSREQLQKILDTMGKNLTPITEKISIDLRAFEDVFKELVEVLNSLERAKGDKPSKQQSSAPRNR